MSLKSINDPASITNPLTKKLKTLLGIKDLEIEVLLRGSGEIIYAFSKGDNGKTIIDAEFNRKEFVIPIVKASTGEPYWMGYSLTFKQNKPKSHYHLFQASIRVFQGRLSDYTMNKVFRAEWMIDKEDSKNAQPHWHVHNVLSEKYQPKFESFDDGEAVIEFGNEANSEPESKISISKRDLSEFHFAMSSQWHKKGGDHFNKLDDQNSLFLWTEGCMKYIVVQLGEMSGIR